MKKSRFTDSQIMAVLKRAEGGETVPELCREVGVSTATFYKWRAKFGGMDVPMMARMKELEDENRRICIRSSATGSSRNPSSAMSGRRN